ncbi:MAG: 5-formyltetrahydrofolate cyclo-ligase [Myxococcaceae bacterium]|nr:5-formyltetrahydrofolate cyclo-ligase [Myxococcaceae bacterium]
MAGNFIEGSKAQVRLELEGRRRALTAEEVKAKGGEAQRGLAALASFQAARTVALYQGQQFEVSTDRLWAGHRICLPRVTQGSKVLSFHWVGSPAELVPRGKYQLLEPPDGAPAAKLDEIDFWVVPGVGFTPAGDRLGRGAAYYDSTLIHARPAPKVGLTFECCLVDWLPTEPHDVRMDEVITELGLRRSRPEPG